MSENLDVWNPTVEVESNYHNHTGSALISESSHNTSGVFAVDLFCGAGGFSVGFEKAGFKSLLGVDIHSPSIDTYKTNHKNSATILGDMREIPEGLIKELVGQRNVGLISAGVPCQGFSLCNRKRWEDDKRNFLFKEFARVVKAISPPYVLVENVSGLVSTKGGEFVKAICEIISDMGYDVDWRMLNAADFGVPQIRNRVFFLGAKKGYPIYWPIPTHGKKTPYRTVKNAIGDLPILGNGEEKSEYLLDPECDFQKEMRKNSKGLINHEAPNHPEETVKRIAETLPGKPMYPKFKQRIRLQWEKPSPTQVSGGIRPQFSFGHPSQPRGLSIRERCRIQSFPDTYEIKGGIVQGRVQTGNAVAPLVAQAIGQVILAGINGTKPKIDYSECETFWPEVFG
jgi:DNA (cytosine-5)-methyltransferase 1